MTPSQVKVKYIRIMTLILTGIFCLTILLAIIFYPAEYKFFQYYISELGGTLTTKSNFPLSNQISQYIFAIGLITTGIIALFISGEYLAKRNRSKLNILKGVCLLLTLIGSILVAFPHNIAEFALIHQIGAFMYVVSLDLYGFFCQFMRYRHMRITLNTQEKPGRRIDKYFVILIILVTLVYFAFYMFEVTKDWTPLVQKIVLLFSVIGMLLLDKEDF